MKFTGFWEASGPRLEEEIAVTLSYVETEDLLERLRVRLESVPPGTWVRLDLIAWDGADLMAWDRP
jgi:hypothetical protein